MFSVDIFYDYLTHLIHVNKKTPAELFRPISDGDKNLDLLVARSDLDQVDKSIYPKYRIQRNFLLLDQEPLTLEHYTCTKHQDGWPVEWNFDNLSMVEKLQLRYASIFIPILFHSDKNNPVTDQFDPMIITSYHWFHGIIAIKWFNPWKFFKRDSFNGKRFGIYARSANGNRTYRLELVKDLMKYSDEVYYQQQPEINEDLKLAGYDHVAGFWPLNQINYNSDASTTISWQDHTKFKIQLVAETVFNSNKQIHLTEKIFKTFVMAQPFILFSNAGSLKYIRDYGFKTFNELWDESYDQEHDHNQRYRLIMKLLDHLYSLSDIEFNDLMIKAQDIVDHNRNHFYNGKFEKMLYDEVDNNFEQAILRQNELFYTFPGGTWFYNVDLYFRHHGVIPDQTRATTNTCMEHLYRYDPKVANAVTKKYNHLF